MFAHSNYYVFLLQYLIMHDYLIRTNFRADLISRTLSARKKTIFARIYFRALSIYRRFCSFFGPKNGLFNAKKSFFDHIFAHFLSARNFLY